MTPSPTVRHLISLAGLIVAIGCGSQSGPERIAVYGTVTTNGESLDHGSISFLPAEGHSGPAANGPISNGKYRFTTDNGPTAGPHRVLVGVAPTKGNDAGPAAAQKPGRWEFEISLSEEEREQDFQLK